MHDVNVHDLQIYNFITSNYSSKKEKANTEKQLSGGGRENKEGKDGDWRRIIFSNFQTAWNVLSSK